MDEPLRPLSDEEVAAFERDGVICARGVMPSSWVQTIAEAIETAIANPSAFGARRSLGTRGFRNDVNMWRAIPAFHDFVFDSPAALIARRVLQSKRLNFFYDQLFVKEPGSDVPTPWHHDTTFWPISGDRVCSIWMPCDPVTRESSGLEFVRGSHRWGRRFQAVTPDFAPERIDDRLEPPPDVEGNRQDYDVVGWAMEPGDLLIFNSGVLHGALGNRSTTTRRRAYSTRWLGDGVVYDPASTQGSSFETPIAPGERLEGKDYPNVFARTSATA